MLAIRNPWTPECEASAVTLTIVTPPATEPITIAEALAQCRIDVSAGEPAPGAITAALASPAAPGNVTAGPHRYLTTFVTADGETEAGAISAAVTVADAGVNGQVALTNIPLGGSNVTARRIYRTVANGSTYFLLATIANNTASTYTDNIADASLGVQAPTTNTTADAFVSSLIAVGRDYIQRELEELLITQTVTAKLDAFPGAIAGRSSFVGGPSWVGIGSNGGQYPIVLPRGPLQSVSSITYVDTAGATQTWSSTLYTVDAPNRRIVPVDGQVYPATAIVPNAVTITCVMGYGAAAAVPASIKHALKLLVAHWYNHREAVNIGNITTEVPLAVESLLRACKPF